MIEFDNANARPERYRQYFAGDGSWGDAEDIVVIDITELDGHFSEFLDELHDWQLPDFMRWYVENQTHDQWEGDTACRVCELWQSGTEDEILEELENEDD
jgi:ferritin